MSFENVAIQSTRNGANLIVGYREDLLASDVISLSLTSMVGVSSVRWEVGGRPEYSVAGGAGTNPWPLGTSPTASFTVDVDNFPVHRDGTYIIWATINPGAPSEARKSIALRRLTGLTIPAPGGLTVPLAKLGGFESLEDTSVPNLLAGWATMLNRWLEYMRGAGGGGGGAVNQVHAGTGITVTGTIADPIINNAGVLLVSAGPGISITGTASLPVVNNTGVLSITAGVNISLGGTAQNPIINAAGGGGGGAAPTLFRRTNIAGMAGIDASVFLTSDAHLCEVLSVGDFYKYVPGTVLTADGITVVTNTGGGGGQWHRLLVPNLVWRAQATWSVDEGNISALASDENTGIDDTHPLRTGPEFVRRMGRCTLTQTTTLRWMSDTLRYSIDLSAINAGVTSLIGSKVNFPLVIVGVPTIVRTGSISSATDAPWRVTDIGLPTSWAASGCLSTSARTRFIRTVDQTKHAFMGYEDIAKTMNTSPTTGYSSTYVAGADGPVSASFGEADGYEVINVPKFPTVMPPVSVPGLTGCYFIYLDMQDVVGGANEYRFCGWRANSTISGQARGIENTLRGCGFVAGGAMSGQRNSTLNRSMVLGGSLNLFGWSGDQNGQVNVVAKFGQLWALEGSHGSLGIVHAYDCANAAIELFASSHIVLDELRGSGNLSEVVNIFEAGCSISGSQTAAFFSATTVAAHPIKIVGKQYDYTDIPIVRLSKNASFTVET